VSIDPSTTAVRVSAGVDWAKDDHAVCVVGGEGEVLDRFAVRHDASGLKVMVRRLLKAGVEHVGIERPDGPVVAALAQGGLSVFVIPPGHVKNLRSRYGSAGNKDDRFDAYVLADVVRTDIRRLRPLVCDSEQTTALRSTVRTRKDLVAHRVGLANQLRAHLQIVFPAATTLFADIDSAISLSFLERFTTQTQADWLSPKRLAAWLGSVAYSGRTDSAVLHARLTAAPRGATGEHATIHAATTIALVAVVRAVNTQIQALANSIGEQLGAPRRADLHLPAPLRDRTRRPAARRDRRRPRPLPHPRLPGMPGRRRPLHPTIGQGQSRHVPLGSRQATARRPVRLRRRLPPRQPLGRRPLPQSHQPRTRPHTRRTHPRPRLGTHHLALLARQPALRPNRPRSPPSTPQPRSTNRGLTQGNSSGRLLGVG
jgi:transposase